MGPARPVAIALRADRVSPLLFQSLLAAARGREAPRHGAPFTASIALHSALVAGLALLPVLLGNALPSVSSDTDFGPVVELPMPAPPPGPPEGTPRINRLAPRRVTPPSQGMITPVAISTEIVPDDLLTDGVGPTSCRGGCVPGAPPELNPIGSVLPPQEAPPPPPKVVRISRLAAPQLLVRVPPVYPPLAIAIRLSGVVEIEAEVDTAGRVTTARVVSGHPLLQDAALDAVRQWRYRSLLLNGEPTAFILNVRVEFNLNQVG